MQHGAYYDDISNFHVLHQAMAPDAVKAEDELDYAGEQTGLLPNATMKHVAKPSAISRLLRWCLAVLVLARVLSIVSYKEFPSTTVIDDLPEISVAFIGNSMMYHNDLPRLLTAISNQHLVQNSCFLGDSSLARILEYGNGMYKKFTTPNALDGNGYYDYGACTVKQLLLGHDDNLDQQVLSTVNSTTTSSYLVDDGTNPCLRNKSYYLYLKSRLNQQPPHWNYIVINDYTLNPGRPVTRMEGLKVLRDVYLPLFNKTGAIPVFFDTHAYWTPLYNLTAFVDVPTLTSVTYEGYLQYASLVSKMLPTSQQPRIAPVGIVFLTVWEESRKRWSRLFQKFDQLHASPLGTLATAFAVFRTLYGQMPDKSVVFRSRDLRWLWSNARVLQQKEKPDPFPTFRDARYLYDVVDRVMGQGYLPKSLILYHSSSKAAAKGG